MKREPILGANTTYKKFHRLHTDQIVLSQLKAWEGAIARVSPDLDGWFLSPQFPTFRVKQDKADVGYISWFLRMTSTWEKLRRESRGMGARRDSVSPKTFLGASIPLPALDEQRRIVARIDELAGLIMRSQSYNETSYQYLEVMFYTAIVELFKNLEVKEYLKLSQCTEMQTGTTPSTNNPLFFDGDIPWYTPGDLGYGTALEDSSRKLSELAIVEGKAKLFRPPCVLVVGIGASLGKTALLTKRGSANQQVTCIYFDDAYSPEFAHLWIRSQYQQIVRNASQATLPIINQKKLGELKIPVVSRHVQDELVRKAKALEEKLNETRMLKSQCTLLTNMLLPAVLQKAFSGNY